MTPCDAYSKNYESQYALTIPSPLAYKMGANYPETKTECAVWRLEIKILCFRKPHNTSCLPPQNFA